jgi:hypothetical protein
MNGVVVIEVTIEARGYQIDTEKSPHHDLIVEAALIGPAG